MTMVKICGLTNLEDARWAWQRGADLLGFVFVRSSPRYVTPDNAAAITRALTAAGCEAKFVGVFANEPVWAVHRIASQCGLHVIQLHGGERPDYARSLGRPVIMACHVSESVPWDELFKYDAWAYLLDSYDPKQLGGTGHTWRWDLLREGPERPLRLIIAGGLTPDNVELVVRQISPWGVDVSSGVEAAPGRKDPDKVGRFILLAKRKLV